MKEWNVVVTVHSVHEGGYSKARQLLERFGDVEKTGFFNILVMRAAAPDLLLGSLEELSRQDPHAVSMLARVMPVARSFSFQSPQEFESRACETARGWLPQLAGTGFHVRMHRRGFRGKLSSMDEERFLDRYLLEELGRGGTPGRITFDEPDAIIALETIGPRAGMALWTGEDLRRHPLLHLD